MADAAPARHQAAKHKLRVRRIHRRDIDHAARLRGCIHIVLEVAENNEPALKFYRKRNVQKFDAAIFLPKEPDVADELLLPRRIALCEPD